MYTSATSAGSWRFAYFVTSNASGTPFTGYSEHNSEDPGGTTITHTATGQYYVQLAGFLSDKDFQVTAYGNTQGGYCTVAADQDDNADVYCFNAAGAPADEQFSFVAFEEAPIPSARSGTAYVATSGGQGAYFYNQFEYSSAATVEPWGIPRTPR